MIIGISGTIGSGKDTVASMIAELSPNNWQVKKFAGKLKQIVAMLTGCTVEDLENEDFKNSNLPPEWDVDGKPQTYRLVLQKLGTELLRDGLHNNVHINALYADYVLEDYKYFTGLKALGTGMKEIKEGERFPFWLLTDLRFANEFDSIKERDGITIRVERYMTFDEWAQKLDVKIAYYNPGGGQPQISKRLFLQLLQDVNYSNPDFFKKHLHSSETGLNEYVDQGKFDYTIVNNGTLGELKAKIKELVATKLL